MKVRGEALELAVALASGDEITLGPSDSALCSAALREYGRKRARDVVSRWMRLPALAVAAFVGVMAGIHADFNGDGRIRVDDLQYLMDHMMKPQTNIARYFDMRFDPGHATPRAAPSCPAVGAGGLAPLNDRRV